MNKHVTHRPVTAQDGITLLVTLLTMGVLLTISASLVNITIKQFKLSGIVHSSEKAFQAAAAGIECALYNDHITGEYDLGEVRDSASCFGVSSSDGISDGDGIAESAEEQRFLYEWGTPEVCTEISVYKFYDASSDVPLEIDSVSYGADCPAGATCTIVQSRGYNLTCDDIGIGNTVEREFTQVY